MGEFHGERMPLDKVRREPLPGIDPIEAHQIEADEHKRMAREAHARGDIAEALKHGLAGVRALERRDGNPDVKLEEEGIDSDLDFLNGLNR